MDAVFADTHEVPSIDTIDTYMAKLHMVILDNPQENESLIATVRDIVGRLNFEGYVSCPYTVYTLHIFGVCRQIRESVH